MRNTHTYTRTAIMLLAVIVFAMTASAASGSSVFNFVSADEAQRAVAQTITTPARAWMWTDDYVYMPGNQLVAWWTVKPEADLYPVTIVGYRVNNQTGVKTYLPNGTTEPTDIFGNAMGDFLITAWPQAEKSPLIGNGGTFPAMTIPNELGMHTLVVEFRDWTGNTVIKRIYQKISVVDQIVTVSSAIESDTTWERTKSYLLDGTIVVRNSTLTIEDGTIIKGVPGTIPAAAIIVRTDSRLVAAGTRSRPIIFTSSLEPGIRQAGDIAGIALLGRAQVNTGTDNLEGLPEGPDTEFGGTDNTHDCGYLSYVRAEFAGAELSPNNELNAITFAGCGTGTVAHHLQAHYGFDDLFEWFGGTNNVSYFVGTGGRDDGFDIQKGYAGKVQHFAVVYYPDNPHDHGIESDNLEDNNSAEPYTDFNLWNATFVGAGSACRTDSCDGWRARRGLKGKANNVVFTNFWDDTVDVRDQVTEDNIRNNELTINGLVAWNNNQKDSAPNTIDGQFASGFTTDWVKGQFGTAQNVMIIDPMLRSIEPSDWDLRGKPGSPLTGPQWALPTDAPFFGSSVPGSSCAGAVCGNDDWTEEWTIKVQESDIRRPEQ